MISEENEGKKFFHFKMPCTIKGVGVMQFQASYIFLCYNYFLSDHPISLPSLARCQLSSVDSRGIHVPHHQALLIL